MSIEDFYNHLVNEYKTIFKLKIKDVVYKVMFKLFITYCTIYSKL